MSSEEFSDNMIFPTSSTIRWIEYQLSYLLAYSLYLSLKTWSTKWNRHSWSVSYLEKYNCVNKTLLWNVHVRKIFFFVIFCFSFFSFSHIVKNQTIISYYSIFIIKVRICTGIQNILHCIFYLNAYISFII